MARPLIRMVVLVLAVLLLHGLGLHELALRMQAPSRLKSMPKPVFARQLRPAAAPTPKPLPAPAVAGPTHAQDNKRLSPVSTTTTAELAPPQTTATEAISPLDSSGQTVVESAPTAGVQTPLVLGAPTPDHVSDTPGISRGEREATAGANLTQTSAWPPDTRLYYRVSGQFRGGPMYGRAQVLWQRNGGDYQVRVEVAMSLFLRFVMTSQGQVRTQGLFPTAYEEEVRGKRRNLQLDERSLRLMHGQSVPRPEPVQDTASQFIEIAQQFQSARTAPVVGGTLRLWLARPNGVNEWVYDIAAQERIDTGLGSVDALHLRPRPLAQSRNNATAEMWFAPDLQYLPVRIRLNFDTENFIDLTAEKIEQQTTEKMNN